MKVQCNRCKRLFEFKRHISIGIGYFQKKDVELCEECEKDMWDFIQGKGIGEDELEPEEKQAFINGFESKIDENDL